jgi:hypothetical protein
VIYPGASAEEVEEALCRRIEDAMDAVTDLEELRCEAREGLATAVAEMTEGGDFARFMDDVKSEMEAIDSFPDDGGAAGRPQLGRHRPGGLHRHHRAHVGPRPEDLRRGGARPPAPPAGGLPGGGHGFSTASSGQSPGNPARLRAVAWRPGSGHRPPGYRPAGRHHGDPRARHPGALRRRAPPASRSWRIWWWWAARRGGEIRLGELAIGSATLRAGRRPGWSSTAAGPPCSR